MFNLGYKEVIINTVNSDTVYIEGDYKIIAGYGRFKDSNITENKEQQTVEKVCEQATWVLPDVSTADTLQVNIIIENTGVGTRHNINFNTTGTSATDIVDGFALWEKIYDISDKEISVTGSITTEIQPGFEYLEVTNIIITPIISSNTSISQIPLPLEKTVTVEGNAGLLYGAQLEASRRFGTFENTNPYSVHEGGNSQGIVMDGKYYGYYIKYDSFDETADEYVKHLFVNASLKTTEFNFAVYILDEGNNIADFKAIFPLK
ncbi:MAG: hypothetical protein KAH32_04685 [Chlamydiia bacterium]|nr:hypothetical protein [Chlamydiia bacterium]